MWFVQFPRGVDLQFSAFGLRGPGVGEPEVAAEATADLMDVDLARIVAVFILFERELEGPRVGPRAAAVRSDRGHVVRDVIDDLGVGRQPVQGAPRGIAGGVLLVLVSGVHPGRAADRKSTRLNSSHVKISYAVFCLKKKNENLYIFNL